MMMMTKELIRSRDVLIDIIVLFLKGNIIKLNEFDFTYRVDNNETRKVFFVQDKSSVKTIYPKGSTVVFSSLSKRPIIPKVITFLACELQVNVLCNPFVDFHYREREWKKMSSSSFPYDRSTLPRRKLHDIVIRVLGIYEPGEIVMTISRISNKEDNRDFFLVTC